MNSSSARNVRTNPTAFTTTTCGIATSYTEPELMLWNGYVNKVFKISSKLHEHQAQVMKCVTYGKDLLNIVRIAGGKGLCFQLPSVLQPDKHVLVISPITALVREQVLKMLDLGINAALLGKETNADVLKMDSVQILYCNPESLFVGPNVQKSKNMENLIARQETGEKKISLMRPIKCSSGVHFELHSRR